MLLKKEPAYRKAEKEDFPLIREFIRRNYKDRWEFEETHTEKRLTRLLFYTYMISRDKVTVATYRDQVVGVLITEKGSHGHFAPFFRLKKGYHFLRLKLTREGRKNLEHFNKLQDMKKQLTVSQENPAHENILFLYVSKDYRRNGIGTGLLKQISTEKDSDCSIYMDQLDHRAFMESHGFVKKNEVSQMRELNKKRFRESVALYQKEPHCEVHS